MPTLDLWFDALPGSFSLVAPFITSLSWNGGAVWIRLRLEPASSAEALQRLAWRYREARHPGISAVEAWNRSTPDPYTTPKSLAGLENPPH